MSKNPMTTERAFRKIQRALGLESFEFEDADRIISILDRLWTTAWNSGFDCGESESNLPDLNRRYNLAIRDNGDLGEIGYRRSVLLNQVYNLIHDEVKSIGEL